MQQRQVSDSREIHFRRLLSYIAIAAELLVTPLGIAQSEQALSHLDEPIQITGGSGTGTAAIQWTPGVRLYRGISYAAPPVGDLRWRSPQLIEPWTGVKAADHFGSACMQPPSPTEGDAWTIPKLRKHRSEPHSIFNTRSQRFEGNDC